LADRRTVVSPAIEAAAMLVSASATARRPEAGASSSATGARSPIAMASPTKVSKPSAVTPTSLTGTCHGPTNWSRATRPPTVRSPILIRKDLSATTGMRSTRWQASASPMPARSSGDAGTARRSIRRSICGALPSRVSSGMSTGRPPSSRSVTISRPLSSMLPSTA
jgi:hypothetical protein